jgi:hypothetical protein
MRIRNVQGWFWFRITAKFAIGISLSFLGPAVIASIVHRFLGRTETGLLDWTSLFLFSCLLIPIVYYAEWRSRGNFFVDEMRAQGAGTDSSYIPASYGEFRLRQGAAVAALFTEILLLAPRLVFSALFDLRQRVELTYDELTRAAEIVLELYDVTNGIPVADLRRGSESPQSLRRIFQYLRFHDWIGVSKRGDNVWLLTTARKWVTFR